MNQATQRLFFALWPDATRQAALHRVGQSLQTVFGGRIVLPQNIHLTLAFLGSVPNDRIDELRAIATSIEAKRFEMVLTETGCWKRASVGWIAPDQAPGQLEWLVLELRRSLLAAGFSVDDKPFAPHVTLLRKARCKPNHDQLDVRVVWRVETLALMASETLQSGPVYSRIGDWSLG